MNLRRSVRKPTVIPENTIRPGTEGRELKRSKEPLEGSWMTSCGRGRARDRREAFHDLFRQEARTLRC